MASSCQVCIFTHIVHHNLKVIPLGLDKSRHKKAIGELYEQVALTLMSSTGDALALFQSHQWPNDGVFLDLMVDEKNGSLVSLSVYGYNLKMSCFMLHFPLSGMVVNGRRKENSFQ